MFQIDTMSRTPVYEQIIGQLKKFILNGVIVPGQQVPSIRGLSIDLTINPNTILKAYSELDSKGIIHSVPGKGYFVCPDALKILKKEHLNKLDELTAMLSNMALAGVPKEDILKCVSDAYELKVTRKEQTNDD